LIDIRAEAAIANSSWSRAKEFRFGDLTPAEALQYLTEKRQLDPACASKILQFCGTRILELQGVSAALASGVKLEGLSSGVAAVFLALTHHRLYRMSS
jgi:hypothetical protein